MSSQTPPKKPQKGKKTKKTKHYGPQFATMDSEKLVEVLRRVKDKNAGELSQIPDDNAFDEPDTEPQALNDAEQAHASEVLSAWDEPQSDPSPTILEKPEVIDAPVQTRSIVVKPEPEQQDIAEAPEYDQTPWTLQQFFNGEIDLDVELSKRFARMPMMASVRFRTLGAHSGRKVASLETQDGSASVIIDADKKTKVIQLSFTLSSMLTLRFMLANLSDADRSRWLELMRRQQGGISFLWGPDRWQDDYLICISRNNHTNIYAFSANSFEAAVRLTPNVTQKLLDWLDEIWQDDPSDESSDDQPLLTW